MKKLLLALLAAAAVALHAPPAHANLVVMCAPDVTAGATGPRTIGGANSAVPSQTIYVLNGQGCAPVLAVDMGYFASQGFTAGAQQQSFAYTTGLSPAGTSIQIGTLPASTYIQHVVLQNTAGVAPGNLSVTTAAGGGTTIVAAVACPANCLIDGTLATNLLTTGASATPTALWLNTVASFNASNITVTVIYGYF